MAEVNIIDAAYALARTGRYGGFEQLRSRMIEDGWSEGFDRLMPIWNDLQRQCRLSKQVKENAASAAISSGRQIKKNFRSRSIAGLDDVTPATV